jgi:phosphoglycolate phosphatase-like HAD superfamily hydrolase
MESRHMRLVLFDIDGTLILTGGAGMRAFHRAMRQVFDLAVSREVVNPDGKTDPIIAREFLAHFGMEDRWNPQSRAALFSAYLTALEEEMERAQGSGSIHILPGVIELLETLTSRHEFAVGLVTGNLEEGARIKLARAGLDHYFRFGGFGSDSEDRTMLIRIGMERGARHVAPAVVRATFVVGDTPLDIVHGRAAGASVIAVASSRCTVADLQDHYPDLLVPDLTDSGRILAFMKKRSRS